MTNFSLGSYDFDQYVVVMNVGVKISFKGERHIKSDLCNVGE